MRIRKLVQKGAKVPTPFYYSDGVGIWIVTDEQFEQEKEKARAVAPNVLTPSTSFTGLSDTFRHFGYGLLRLTPKGYTRTEVVEYKKVEERGSLDVIDYDLTNHPLLKAFLKQRIAEGSDKALFEVWQNEFLWIHETPWIRQTSFVSQYDGATHTIGF